MSMSGMKNHKIKSTFNRVYQFSAAHRLHNPLLSTRANQEIYDKCNNSHGHGHDYKLEVTIMGEIDSESGMIIQLEEFDAKVNSVLKTLDHHHLDMEIAFFKNHVSTGEIIIQFLWQKLNKRLPSGMLFKLKLWETNNNYFEIKD